MPTNNFRPTKKKTKMSEDTPAPVTSKNPGFSVWLHGGPCCRAASNETDDAEDAACARVVRKDLSNNTDPYYHNRVFIFYLCPHSCHLPFWKT